MSLLRKTVDDYLAMRRSLGFKLRDMGYCLHDFVSFMEEKGEFVITVELALRWAQLPQNVAPAHWATRLSFVRTFAKYWRSIDPRTEVPPVGLLPFHPKRANPYIYSDDEIQHLLRAASILPPPDSLRSCTYYTLLGLMTVTGMRISEIINLDRDDVDFELKLLTVRSTKFGKSRLVPLHPSTVEKLRLYLNRREEHHPRPSTNCFFLSNQGTPLTDCTIRHTFVKLSEQIGLRKPGDSSGPRIHDLRHRFAVTTLLHWYESGVDVQQRMPVLSTFLGHAHVTDTYWYLTAIPQLMVLTKDRLENRWEDLT